MKGVSKKSQLVLGIMSGTSIDAVDYALCEIADGRIRLDKLWQARFPSKLQARLHGAATGTASSHELGQLHHDLGRFYACHALPRGLKRKPEIVGLHGQTVYHNPDRKAPATLQIGEAAWIAEALRVPVVSNFRAADIAAGGQGAPMATVFHEFVFAQRGRHLCVNNLGGISNVTSLDWRRGKKLAVMAFDTGPANVLLDIASRHFSRGKSPMDRDGAWARRGRIHEPILDEWLRHPFFALAPPKSTGRELFGESFWRAELPKIQRQGLSQFDTLATLTAFTARSITSAYDQHLPSLPDRVVLAGGGAANPVLKDAIAASFRQLSSKVVVVTSNELGWPSQSIEPAAFALLAWLRMHGRPGNLAETTGASRAVLSGQITEV